MDEQISVAEVKIAIFVEINVLLKFCIWVTILSKLSTNISFATFLLEIKNCFQLLKITRSVAWKPWKTFTFCTTEPQPSIHQY